MQKITNLTNGPIELDGKDGKKIVPAYGSVEGEFAGEYLTILEASNAVTVEAIRPAKADAKSKGKQ